MRSGHPEPEDERRPTAFLAFHVDRPAVGAHDPEGHRQAKPRSLAWSLGCEERLEDAGLNRPWDAGPVVFHEELDESVVPLGCPYLDCPMATGFHGLLRVEDEIHQDLLDLVRAAMDDRQVRRNRGLESDPAQAQLMMEDRLGARDYVLQRDQLGRQVLLPRD